MPIPKILSLPSAAFLSDQWHFCPFQPNFFSTKQHEANPNRSSPSSFCFSLASPTYFHPLCFNGRPASSCLSCQEHNFQMPLFCSGFCSRGFSIVEPASSGNSECRLHPLYLLIFLLLPLTDICLYTWTYPRASWVVISVFLDCFSLLHLNFQNFTIKDSHHTRRIFPF